VTSERLYLRPTGFVDGGSAQHGQTLRLAGGPCHFALVEVIAVAGGRRVRQELIPVERLDAALDNSGRATLARIVAPRPAMMLGVHRLAFEAPQVMGIVNATPDSFSDGGTYDPVAHGRALLRQGAAILDVGGESTRPGAETVADDAEIARVSSVVTQLGGDHALLSIDTRKAAVMAAALDAGAHIVNDVSALLWDDRALALVAARACPVVLMHHQGEPATMQDDPHYDDVLLEVYDWLDARIEAAIAAGIRREHIIVDPGVGFGKTLAHNVSLLAGLSLLHGLGCPILLGVSRKRTIAALAGDAPFTRRVGGSVALAVSGAAQGVQLHRVHDVHDTVQALRVWYGVNNPASGTTC
jgi:dihydropteroate synthase